MEADNLQQARDALKAQPDILQLDKFSIEDITLLQQEALQIAPRCHLSVAGGINLNTIEKYAQTGIGLIKNTDKNISLLTDKDECLH